MPHKTASKYFKQLLKIPAKRVSRHVIPFAFGLFFVKSADKMPFFAKQIASIPLQKGLFQ